MKELARFFKSRYSTVNSNEDEHQQYLSAAEQANNPALLMQRSTMADKQRRKSLKANRSMNPANIIASFFSERQNNAGARTPKCSFLLLAIGVLAITTAVLVKIFQPYDMIFKWKLVMEKEGEIFNLWEKPPIDLYLKVYLFNITNAEAFLAGRERLKVEQVGPYVYKEIMTHENVTFNSNNTMSGYPSHPLVWQEHLSEGRKENDTVIMVDIALLSILHTTHRSSFMGFGNSMLLLPFFNPRPIAKMTAKEFMFGYPSKLTKLGNKLFPSWIIFESVGLIDRMYDFRGDFETFHTGVPNPAISGLYSLYRGEKNLPQWDEEHCSNIEMASDGTKFKSFIKPEEQLKFFRKSMCRPVNLYRVGEPEIHGSLQGFKYVFEENALDNGAVNKNNKCFCRKGLCQPRGLLDVSDCYYKFPISLSYPHFMDGDEGLITNVTGLTPNKELHSSSFVVQPESGLPLSLSVKMQINMHFNEMPRRNNIGHFSHLTVPMLWFDITMPKLPESLDSRFNFYINYLKYLDIIGFWGGLVLGVALLVYSVTRATLHMSAISQADKVKYAKANLFQSTNNVYNPCEMKLMEKDEKSNFSNDHHKQKLIPSSSSSSGNSSESESDQHQKQKDNLVITRSIGNISDLEQNILYTDVELSKKRHSAYALDLEPALSDDDIDDEYRDTESSGSLSHNSTASSCMDIQTDDSNSNPKLDQHHNDKQTSISSKSSGLASSISNSQFAEDLSTDFIWPMSAKTNGTSNQSSTSS